MMEANETADQFDELLSQLRIDEMNPVEVQESSDTAVDTENLPHCSSCGGPIVGQVTNNTDALVVLSVLFNVSF